MLPELNIEARIQSEPNKVQLCIMEQGSRGPAFRQGSMDSNGDIVFAVEKLEDERNQTEQCFVAIIDTGRDKPLFLKLAHIQPEEPTVVSGNIAKLITQMKDGFADEIAQNIASQGQSKIPFKFAQIEAMEAKLGAAGFMKDAQTPVALLQPLSLQNELAFNLKSAPTQALETISAILYSLLTQAVSSAQRTENTKLITIEQPSQRLQKGQAINFQAGRPSWKFAPMSEQNLELLKEQTGMQKALVIHPELGHFPIVEAELPKRGNTSLHLLELTTDDENSARTTGGFFGIVRSIFGCRCRNEVPEDFRSR